jgi:hypothetical protein
MFYKIEPGLNTIYCLISPPKNKLDCLKNKANLFSFTWYFLSFLFLSLPSSKQNYLFWLKNLYIALPILIYIPCYGFCEVRVVLYEIWVWVPCSRTRVISKGIHKSCPFVYLHHFVPLEKMSCSGLRWIVFFAI